MMPLHDEVRLLRDLGDGRRVASLKAWTARLPPVSLPLVSASAAGLQESGLQASAGPAGGALADPSLAGTTAPQPPEG